MPKFWTGARPIAASVLALVVVGACVTVSAPASPGRPTQPPDVSLPPIPSVAIPSISIPSISIPSIAIPSIAIPSISIPSVAIPSISIPSISIPSVAIPSIAIPSISIPSIEVPSLGVAGDCSILSTAKADAATGINWTLADNSSATECTFVDSTLSGSVSGFNVRKGTNESISTARLLDPNGQDMTVAGHAAFWGPTFHQLYVDLGGDTLVILLVTSDDTAGLDLAQKLANAYFAQ